jgi:hypothetical protein
MIKAGPEGAELPSAARISAGTLLCNASAFLAACALICLGLGATLPFPELPTLEPKYRFFAQRRNDYDVLFLGSSRFFHQIIPKQFDETVAATAGKKLRSFNIACDALWPPESFYFLHQILALRPAHLRWVVIELMHVDPRIRDPEKPTRREAYWHDWEHTRMAWDGIEYWPKITSKEKRTYAIGHALLLLEQWVNLGRGSEFLEPLFSNPKERSERTDAWMANEGFRAGPEHGLPAEELNDYNALLEKLKTKMDPIKVNPALSKAVEKATGEIRAAGAEPIFVIGPSLNFRENFAGLPDNVLLLPFNDPNKFPSLYDPAIHYDAWHLNGKGAIEFTDFLARDFAAHLHDR